MAEKLRGHEAHPPEDISQWEKEKLEQAVNGYLVEHPGFSEVTDGDLEKILSRLVEKGVELPPDLKRSLRKAAQHLLGIRLQQ